MIKLVDIEEMSTSDGAGAYDTPNAFGELPDSAIEVYGYKKVKKKKNSKYMEVASSQHLSESYIEFIKDPFKSAEAKLNQSISTINSTLRQLERVIAYNVKLKDSIQLDNRVYGADSKRKIEKINDRMITITQQLTNLIS